MKKGAVFAPLLLLFLAFSAPSQTPVNDLAARISESRYKWSTSSTLFQSPRSDIITLQNAAAADGNGTAFDVGSYGGVALQIAGSFTATITFEATIDRSNWIAVKADNLNDRTSATTATAAGLYSVPLSGAVQFRARVSDHSGGTVTVKARGVAGYIGLRQSSGGGGGGSVDSVFGRTGDVVAATNDYTWAQINKTTSSLANITTRSASDLSSGTLAADRGGAGTVNGIMKANGSGVVSAAVSATDYAPATSGSSILKGNGSGGFSNAASGTDYAPATSGSAILKGNGSGGFSAAVADTDYQQPLTFTAGVARVTNAISLDQSYAPTWTGAHIWSGVTGTVRRNSIGTSSTDGWILENTTAAAAGAQQYSPRLRLTGSGWKTNATAAAQTVDWIVENRPVQGAANPTANLAFQSQINGGGYTTRVSFTSAGAIDISGASTNAILMPDNSTAGIQAQSSNGNIKIGNLSGVGLTVTNALVTVGSSSDVFYRRAAAANLAFGAADAASPVAQTLSVQNVSTGTSNTAGANWTFNGSRGTGTGAGGDIIFQTAPAGTTGTSQNALAAAFTVKGDGAVQLKSVTFANLPTVANGYLIYCSDCTLASPCASGGSGALAKGINSAWVCN